MKKTTINIVLALFLLTACGEGEREKTRPNNDVGQDVSEDSSHKDTGNEDTTGDSGDLGNWTTTPILEREVQNTKTCSIVRPFETLEKDRVFVKNPHLASRDGNLWVGYAEQKGVVSVLRFGELDDEGKLTNDTEFENSEWYSPALQIHPNDDGSLMIISQHTDKEIQSTIFDAQGSRGPGKTLVQSGAVYDLRSLSGHGKTMVFWSDLTVQNLMVIDSTDGKVIQESTAFSDGRRATTLTVTDDGFIVLRSKPRGDEGLFDIVALTFDKEGKATNTGDVIYTSKNKANHTWGSTSLDLLTVDDGYLMAWSEREEASFEESKSMVHLAKLNKSLEFIGKVDLTIAEKHLDISVPSLAKLGDEVALFWSEGQHIYICAGCIPDHKVNMILLDPKTLDPLSPKLKIDSEKVAGGLLERQTISQNDRLNIISLVQYHVHSESAFGIVECK